MSKKNYGHEHLVYLGNYLAPTDPNFSKTKEELLKMYDPYLEKINPHYKKDLIGYELFKAPFAQPIVTTHYSKKIPPIITPFKHTFLANIQQVYPWDRGTNYAVELGKKAIEYITK
jgi:protoporphyrinogen oxidase